MELVVMSLQSLPGRRLIDLQFNLGLRDGLELLGLAPSNGMCQGSTYLEEHKGPKSSFRASSTLEQF